ncbi:SHOCT domain-containing protein [Microbacterium thalassium]|uniref:Putative membrane protein n=1 Tax=Microbacterium thalassium TaxID=362649 RepID=A0A7X0FSQ0_9MICO|nr:SHOCT domain-containing protein [Microbacterium thalassium]MBB6392994.1 putative membrane protein [Microbacterium thalassium]GLK22774.1 hypothetical protein GCM10017607_00920 [Microbacterium thalassium]
MMWDDDGGSYGMGFGMGWGWGWVWAILVLVGIGLLVYVAIRLSLRPKEPREPTPPVGTGPAAGATTGSAQQILEERYARGEIDTDEFTERMRVLRGG